MYKVITGRKKKGEINLLTFIYFNIHITLISTSVFGLGRLIHNPTDRETVEATEDAADINAI